MTFQEFRELAYGVNIWQIYLEGKWVNRDVLSGKYNNLTITEFEFEADDNGRVICTLDLKK